MAPRLKPLADITQIRNGNNGFTRNFAILCVFKLEQLGAGEFKFYEAELADINWVQLQRRMG
jgi:hypothetical protein